MRKRKKITILIIFFVFCPLFSSDCVTKVIWDSERQIFACRSKKNRENILFLDEKGTVVYESDYFWVSPLIDGFSLVAKLDDTKNRKYGFINEKMQKAIEIKYDFSWLFKEGYARVKKNDQWGYINKKGEVVIPVKFDEARDFNYGIAVVKFDGKYGHINYKGTFITKPVYEDAGRYTLKDCETQVGLNGWLMVSCKGIGLFPTGLKASDINKNDLSGILDLGDKTPVDPDGLFPVKIDGKWGKVDQKGNIIVKPVYRSIDTLPKKTKAVFPEKTKE